MKELDNMKEVFDIFVDSCEKAGVKFGKEEDKKVEEVVIPELKAVEYMTSSGLVQNQKVQIIGMMDGFFVDEHGNRWSECTQIKEKVEEWPKVGDEYFYRPSYGGVICNIYYNDTDNNWRVKNIPTFKIKKLAEKYYSIIDTINNIVDELGRPTWEDFEDASIELSTIFFVSASLNLRNYVAAGSYEQNAFFPWCKKIYLEQLLKKVSEEDLLWAFKYSMGFRG